MYHRNSKGNFIFTGEITPAELFAAADALATEGLRNRDEITGPESLIRYLKTKLMRVEHEVFYVIYLDARHGVIAAEPLFRGGLTGAAVYVGEVVKAALLRNAAAIVCSHNHPSSNPNPSAADREITERLRQGLALVEIRLLDHVVIGGSDHVSFAERGWL